LIQEKQSQLNISIKAYIARINEVNGVLRAINAVNSNAIETAKKYDLERASGKLRGVLHGIPILVKDVFLTTDGTDTTGKTGSSSKNLFFS